MNIETVCRLCRREADHLESLLGIREGLPLSVIIMIICPIKIELKDSLPKFVCGECLEVVLSAYKIREESLQSDRFLREAAERESLIMEDVKPIQISVQQENFYADPLAVFTEKADTIDDENISMKKARKYPFMSPRNIQIDFKKNEEFPYEVDCFKSGKHKSRAWDYFGRLTDRNGEIIESEADYYFCKICVAESKSIRKRFSSKKISTGMIFQHLKSIHGIEKEPKKPVSESEDDQQFQDLSKLEKSVAIQGLTFACTESHCDKVFNMKICLDIHLGLEHTGIADEEPANTDFHVDISVKDHTKSMAWKYFGPLLDFNLELVDESSNYCRLCIGNGTFSKYAKSCSAATLLHHLRDQHVQAKRKRKRFGNNDSSQ